jgi:iron complex outermembrane receptor protein
MLTTTLLLLASTFTTANGMPADTIPAEHLGEVIVTGSNQAVGKDLLPFTVSTLTRGQIESSGESQLLSVLSGRVPSLFVTERNMIGFGVSNGGSGLIKIRGVGGEPTNAILMMVDGQPQYSGVFSHHVADFYDTEYVDKVEVLRGPASVLYGSNAMGGVVNVITRDAEHEGAHTSLKASYGSHNTLLSSITNTLRYGRFSSLVSVSYDRTDGIRKDFDFNEAAAFAKIGYKLSDNWRTTADYSFMRFKGNDPVYPTLSNPESTDIYRQNVIRGEASLGFINRYDSTDGCVRVYYGYGNHIVDDPRHFRSTDDRLGVIAYQNFSPWRGSHVTAGFDFDTYTGRIPMSGGKPHEDGSMTTFSRKRVNEYSPYVTISQGLLNSFLNLNTGLRMVNSNKFHTQWIPQAGFVIRPTDEWSIKASIAKGYRNPSFKELYLYRMANPDLQPERMMNYEVSTGSTLTRYLIWEVTAYYSKGSNMIQQVEMKNRNTGSFINKGVEISLTSHPVSTLMINATYSYLHTSLRNLTGAPRHQYFLGIRWNPFNRFSVDAQMKGIGHLYVADNLEHENYITLDLRGAYRVCSPLLLFIKLDNITDTRYQINRGYDMPGFTAMGGFKLDF